METTDRLNAVIEYIEEHITEPLPMDVLARLACCSRYDFQRMFTFLANMSVSEYIRKRRMTLAGTDLRGGMSVMEAATKYGYTSAVSFARAFRAFHGINPGEAKRGDAVLNTFNRLQFQPSAKEVAQRDGTVTVSGRCYDTSYLGQQSMAAHSDIYVKRIFRRVEGIYGGFPDAVRTHNVLPYDSYPVESIEAGQVFVIDYYKKDGTFDRKYYAADGATWQGMTVTTEILPEPPAPERVDIIKIGEREYEAEYYGAQDMSRWSKQYRKREFWRLRDAFDDLKKCRKIANVLPYNNYPPIKIRVGQAFVIDLHGYDGSVQRRYYLADGTVWMEMPSTAQYAVE